MTRLITAHGAGLMLAPGTRDALLQPGRVPRQVEVDHHACHLKVEAEAAGVAGEEQPAERILLETANLHPAPLLGHGAVVPNDIKIHLPRQLTYQLQHADPFRKDDDFAVRLGDQIREHAFQLLQLGTDPAIRDRVGRVAEHAHAGQPLLQPVELLAGQASPPGDRQQSRRPRFVVLVAEALLGSMATTWFLTVRSGS